MPPMDSPDSGGAPSSRGPDPTPLPSGFLPLAEDDPAAVGPFRLVGQLGAGGMGAVYGALDAAERHVAVKVVHARHAADAVFRAQFAREAELLRRVDAECAPAFLGADPDAERPWMATEFVPGATLSAHVREHGVLTADRLLSFAAGTAEALAAVHHAGVVHRDIKPANVILAPSGPKVLDFGIARATDDRSPEEGVFGTPGWIAPERLDGGENTPAVDMFAWGGLVVYAATGHGPFGAGDTATLIARARAAEPDLEGVPEDLLPLVSRALSRDPAERPASVEAFAAVLDLTGAGEPSDDLRTRLWALLTGAWTGFAAVRGAGPWVAAAGSVGMLTGSSALVGAGTTAGGAMAAQAGGAGTIAGMSKLTAVVVATATATAVTTGAWIGGRLYSDQPVLPFGEQSATAEPSSEAEGERVEFRGMTLTLPEGWTALTVEEEFGNFSVEEERVTEEWMVLYPGGQEGCEGVDWTWGYGPELVRCHHVRVLGPAGIDYGGEAWQPIDRATPDGRQGRFGPGTDAGPCPYDVELSPVDPGVTYADLDYETVAVGDREASYAVGPRHCADMNAENAEFSSFEQRSWLLDEPQILIVDEYGIEELDAILAGAEWRRIEEEQTQTVEFRGMTLELPAAWEVERREETGTPFEGPPVTSEAVTVTPNPGPDCDSPALVATCPQFHLLGPAGIAVGYEINPMTEDDPYYPRTDVVLCPLPPYVRGPGEVVEEQGLAPVGERTAYYRVWEIGCMPLGEQLPPGGSLETFYEQRYWLLPESEILVVDEYTTPGLGEILARADLPA
ncbi:serine/threonine-protein kinase [Nocardiopsis aegyptia]|uniref:serine/threonine-protein kinase n=1 Tax=Nocardiopsis aegyptia TaxID=220378 RepID=UPI00366B5F15